MTEFDLLLYSLVVHGGSDKNTVHIKDQSTGMERHFEYT